MSRVCVCVISAIFGGGGGGVGKNISFACYEQYLPSGLLWSVYVWCHSFIMIIQGKYFCKKVTYSFALYLIKQFAGKGYMLSYYVLMS